MSLGYIGRRKRKSWRRPFFGLALGGLLVGGYLYQQRLDEASATVSPLDPDPAVVAARPIPDVGVGAEGSPAPTPTMNGPGRSVDGELQRDERFVSVLESMALPRSEVYAAVAAMEKVFDFKRLRPGTAYVVNLTGEGTLHGFRLTLSPLEVYEVAKKTDAFEAIRVEIESRIVEVEASGRVESSLWNAIKSTGEGAGLLPLLVDVFAWDIDFYTDTRAGDRFAVVVEKVFVEDQFVRYGRVLAAAYVGQAAGRHKVITWAEREGHLGYYTPDGNSVKKAFLKSPLKFTRITSGFGKRFHPVLHKMKAHLGVDYAAPTGTPARAIGDGTIRHAGWKGANGNLVIIQHANGYRSYYAHLSRIARGIKPGVKVEQKHVIGRVGSTGRSTGPHLHLGMSKNGTMINPMEVRRVPERSVAKARMAEFRAVATPLTERLEHLLETPETEPVDLLQDWPQPR